MGKKTNILVTKYEITTPTTETLLTAKHQHYASGISTTVRLTAKN